MKYAAVALVVTTLASGQTFDAARLRTGRFVYRTVANGKDAGGSEITISRDGNFRFTNHVTGQFVQDWEATTTAAFAPIAAKLTFGEDRKPSFELVYRDRRVAGAAWSRQTAMKRDVQASIVPDTVDQRIDWAAVMSAELTGGREFRFHVYDPGAGNSLVTAVVSGPETVEVPAGKFTAMRVVYRIDKAGGSEVYLLLTNREGPRMLLKEEFPNGAVTELVEAAFQH